jgi:hypothetical protein
MAALGAAVVAFLVWLSRTWITGKRENADA